MTQQNSSSPLGVAPPLTSKERMQKVAAAFVGIVNGLSENQCIALETTGVLRLLDMVLGSIRAGQLAGSMTVTEVIGVLQSLVANGRKR
jgi:hypothetical protein